MENKANGNDICYKQGTPNIPISYLTPLHLNLLNVIIYHKLYDDLLMENKKQLWKEPSVTNQFTNIISNVLFNAMMF